MRKIPNLRKLSVSPWNDYKKILPAINGDYVASIKPNPAIFVDDVFNVELARDNLERAIQAGGEFSHIEFIMKDISTLRYKPQNLWKLGEHRHGRGTKSGTMNIPTVSLRMIRGFAELVGALTGQFAEHRVKIPRFGVSNRVGHILAFHPTLHEHLFRLGNPQFVQVARK